MKYIQKDIRNEPQSLKTYRSTPNATYDDCNKADIRLALLKEQGFICAYCMKRISDKMDKRGNPITRIEHYTAQSTEESLRLNYLNMLGVCNGNEGNPRRLLHCDQSRGNILLTINPCEARCETLVKFRPDGEIYSDDETINTEKCHNPNYPIN